MPNPVREMKQIASNDVNSYVKTDLRGILKTAWFVQSVKRGKLTKTTATASYWGCHYQWTYPILTKKTHTRLPFTVACTDRGSQEMWAVTLHPPPPPTPNSNSLGFIGGITRPDNRHILCSQPKS